MNTASKSKKLNVLSMAQISVCTALLCVSAWISIPIPIISVPFTLQALAIILVALLLKPAYALTAQIIYTLLGIVGLPVFFFFFGGIGSVLSPTGGFIIGFIISAFLVSLLKGKTDNILRYILISIFVGIPAMYIPGIIGFMLYTGSDLLYAIVTLTSVFIVVDIVKCIIASLAAVALKKALSKANIGFER